MPEHLLTHTSGFVYDTRDANMLKYEMQTGAGAAGAGIVTVSTVDVRAGERAGSTGPAWIGRDGWWKP